MNKNPLVSICLPLYNGIPLVSRALQSCINQTYENLEIVVVDDASTDDTISIVKEFMAKSPKIKLFQNEKNLGGAAKNFLKSYEMASGYFVNHMGHDDWLEPNYIEEKVKVFIENPEILIVSNCFSSYHVSNDNDEPKFISKLCKRPGLYKSSDIYKRFYKEPGLIGMSSMIRREDALKYYMMDIPNKYGYLPHYERSMVIDNLLMLRILASAGRDAHKMYYTDKSSYNALEHPTNISKTYGWLKVGNIDDVLKFNHIDLIGYDYFFRTYDKEDLLQYRLFMGYKTLGDIIFLYLKGGRNLSRKVFKFYFSDYTILEKLLLALMTPFYILKRGTEWIGRYFN